MKKYLSIYHLLAFVLAGFSVSLWSTGCANIVPPGGGPRDTLPPILIGATPKDSSINITSNRITLYFNEYVEVQEALQNVIISPLPTNTPLIDYKLRTISIRLRDTLETNTTYAVDFGNAIKDVNEGNIYKNFTYVFSTGATLDNNTLSGRVLLARNGKPDSTMIAVLHGNATDSAVVKEKPRYITRLDGKGNFQFNNLPSGTYSLYAIPNDFSRRYDDTTKPFAFAAQPVNLDSNLTDIALYAFEKEKPVVKPAAPAVSRTANEKKRDQALRFNTNLQGNIQDLLDSFTLTFNRPIAQFDSSLITFTDKNFNRLPGIRWITDSNATSFKLAYNWLPNAAYNLLIDTAAFVDSAGISLTKNDTIKITGQKTEAYGSLKITFTNLDLTKNPVLLLVQNDQLKEASPITQRIWVRKLFSPGEYEIRILYDDNNNGKWDTGEFFGVRRQPEIVKDLNIKIVIRANWDNEKEIVL